MYITSLLLFLLLIYTIYYKITAGTGPFISYDFGADFGGTYLDNVIKPIRRS